MHPDQVRGWLEEAIADSQAVNSPRTLKTESSFRGYWYTPPKDLKPALESSTSHSSRSLATVRYVASVDALTKDFRILTIDGWTVVVHKNRRFTQGEYVLFLEPGAFLPHDAPIKALWNFAQVGPLTEFENQVGYKVETSEFYDQAGKKVTSEGHVFHLSDFPDINQQVRDLDYENSKRAKENFLKQLRGLEFSDDLGIKKWGRAPNEMQAPNQTKEEKEDSVAPPEPRKRKPKMRLGNWVPNAEEEAMIIRIFQETEEWIENIYRTSKTAEEMKRRLMGSAAKDDSGQEKKADEAESAEEKSVEEESVEADGGQDEETEEGESIEPESVDADSVETDDSLVNWVADFLRPHHHVPTPEPHPGWEVW